MTTLRSIKNSRLYANTDSHAYVAKDVLNGGLLQVRRRRGRRPRHYLAKSNQDMVGWYRYHLGQDYFAKLPRKLKKKFKQQALQDYADFGDVALPFPCLRQIRLTEVFSARGYSLRSSNFIVNYHVAR